MIIWLKRTIYVIFLSLLFAGPIQAQPALTISGIEGSINHHIGGAILKAAYGKIGMSITTVAFPAKRSLVMANAGEFDGEVQRISDMNRHYPNLIAVPEPILYLESSVFVKDPGIRIDSWEALSPYLIGIPRGIMYLENRTKGMRRIFVKSTDQLFHLLNNGRIDVVIISTNYGRSFLSKHQDMNIRMLAPPILKIPLYHYLHRKHKSLVPKITESIRQMRLSGELDKISSEYFERN